MRRVTSLGLLLVWVIGGIPSYGFAQGAQGKKACDLVTRADVESILGVTLEEPTSTPDGSSCNFTNWSPNKPRPTKRVDVQVLVNYSAAPDPVAVEKYRKMIDEKTYHNPLDLPDIGDLAFWHESPQYATVTVFTGGTLVLTVQGAVTLEQSKALALKALGGPAKTGYVYGTPRAPLPQLALAKLYEFGTLAPDGAAKPDHAGAAYWYARASDQGDLEATSRLGLLYRDGLGVPANPASALELLRKAAMAGYVPAMVPLAYVYFAAGTPVSPMRRNYWAQQAAEKNDPAGWTLTGYLYNKGQLGGGPPYYYKMAMDAYLKGAEGGDCLAMMNIGGLYFNGDGVPQDRALAQSWFQKAEACQGKDLDWMREKAAKYRQRAASGRLPAVQEAKPESQRPTGGGKMTMSDAEKVFAGLLALMVIGAAMDIATGSGDGTGGSAVGGSSSGSSSGYTGSRGSTSAPVRYCRQVQVGSFSTQHGRGAISPGGATTTV